MGTHTLMIGEQEHVGKGKIASRSIWSDGPTPGTEARVNASRTPGQVTALTSTGAPVTNTILPVETKEHSECFTCSRMFFGRHLERCPRCGSRSLQHYTAGELDLFARPGDVGLYLVPKSRTELLCKTG